MTGTMGVDFALRSVLSRGFGDVNVVPKVVGGKFWLDEQALQTIIGGHAKLQEHNSDRQSLDSLGADQAMGRFGSLEISGAHNRSSNVQPEADRVAS